MRQEPNLTHRSMLLSEIAHAYAKAGRFDEAMALVSRATRGERPGLGAEALAEIATEYLKYGFFDEMLATVDTIAGLKDWRSWPALSHVATACSDAGKVDLGTRVAQRIDDGFQKTSTLISLARRCIRDDAHSLALALLVKATAAASKAKPLTYEVWRPGSAMKIWVYDNEPAFSLLVDIAKAYVEVGQTERAEGLAALVDAYAGNHHSMGNLPGWRAKVLFEVAEGHLKARNPTRARGFLNSVVAETRAMTTDTVGDIENRTELFLRGAHLARRVGEEELASTCLGAALDEAQKLQSVDEPEIRVTHGCAVLGSVAQGYLEASDNERARKILEDAEGILRSQKKTTSHEASVWVRLGVLYEKAHEFQKAKKLFARAEEATLKTRDPCRCAQSWVDMVETYLAFGDTARATKAASMFQSNCPALRGACSTDANEGFSRVIQALRKDGKHDEIWKVADMMAPSWAKVEALATLANNYEHAGDSGKARKVIFQALRDVEAAQQSWERQLVLVANTYEGATEKANPAALEVLERLVGKL